MVRVMSVMAIALLAMASCNKEAQKVDEKTQAHATQSGSVKIAYVEVDSIMSQYKFCKEYSLILQKKSQNIENTLAAKQNSLQAAAAKFQQDVQNNKYTQQQAEAVQANLQKQGADLQALQQRLGAEFQNETNTFNKALRDSIQHYLAAYNKDKKVFSHLSKYSLCSGTHKSITYSVYKGSVLDNCSITKYLTLSPFSFNILL